MKNTIKQLFSFILPITVLIIVPHYIEKNGVIKNLTAFIIGLIIICIGLFILIITISIFIRIGKGTLAPWSPARKMVITGMYRYVRNPMIIGVLIVLIGESISIMSFSLLIWALAFFIINSIYFVLYEEPKLEKRFGAEYREYKSNVPRWIPSFRPFIPESEFD